MGDYPNAAIAPTTKQNAFLHMSRRSAILPKGKFWSRLCLDRAHSPSAKYIEGLENRLGRMEQLLKISGLITDEEAGRTDLGAIERRLAEKNRSQSLRTNSPKSNADTPNGPSQRHDSKAGTPQNSNLSPRESVNSPGSSSGRPEVENISDMMCSLVTSQSGETRYIGMFDHIKFPS